MPTQEPGKIKSAIIIGGGFAGLTASLSIRNIVDSIVIIDDCKNSWSASKACHGISTIKGIFESDSELFDLKIRGHCGFDYWLKSVEDLLGISRPADVWRLGVTEKFIDLYEFRKDFGRIYRRDFFGAKRIELRTGHKEYFAESFYPGDWWVDPCYVMDVLRAAVLRSGTKIFDQVVADIVPSPNDFSKVVTKNGETFESSIVILATGAMTPKLLERSLGTVQSHYWVGVPGHSFKAPVTRERICEVKRTNGIIALNGWLHWGSSSDKSLDLGADEMPEMPLADGVETGTTLLSQFNETSIPRAEVIPRWGVRIRNRARSPVVEKVFSGHRSSIWINTGYYKSGLTLSWIFAEILAEKIKLVAKPD